MTFRWYWPTVPLLCSIILGACSSKNLSCGEGTEQDGDECLAIPESGAGGEGGAEADPQSPEKQIVIVDRDGRSDTQKQVEEEFEGAIAAAPVDEASILVVWKALPIEGLRYNIYIAEDEDDLSFGVPQGSAPAGASDWTIQGLKEGREYSVAVVPVLAGIELEVGREPVTVTPRRDEDGPSFTGLKAGKAIDGAGVKLSWDEATDELSSPPTIRYAVFYGTDPKFAEDEHAFDRPFAVSARGATSMDVFGLPEPETEYFFVVRAVDAAGNPDDNTNARAVTTGEDKEPPSFAGCDSATALTASIIEVSWTEATDRVSPADDIVYNFYVSEGDDFNFSVPDYTVTGGTSAEIPGLDRDTPYSIVCRAADPSGNEDDNERIQRARTNSDSEPPDFDGVVTPIQMTSSSIELVWNEAEDNQTAQDELEYLVHYSLVSGFDLDDEEVITVSTTGTGSILLSDLLSNTEYFIRVSVLDGGGLQSDPSDELAVTTLVSLRRDVEIAVYANKCATSSCHAGAGAAAGLNLSLGWSYDSTVDKDAISGVGAGKKLVLPGDPAASHLVERIESTVEGVRMPLDLSVFLSEQEIDTIKLWITQGALNN